VITVGVDLAAEPKKTAVARVTWADGAAVVTELHEGADNKTIVRAAREADKVGIDCPLGWPAQFIEFVSSHRDGQVVVPAGEAKKWRRALAWRVTDEDIRDKTKLIPLSVAADRIGHAAMRCAALLTELADDGLPVDRAGTGVVVEVYPAASMRRWDITSTGYKGSNGKADALAAAVESLKLKAAWLNLGEYEHLCRKSDDAFDAVIAALTARAAAVDLTSKPDPSQLGAARIEGWIALPDQRSLNTLPR
jgi:predicted nuclease with RNAse H fold